jgi:hypothetical protein
VQEIQSAIKRLPGAEMREIYEWLENAMEDQLVLKEGFEAQIKISERELAQGKRPRTRQP